MSRSLATTRHPSKALPRRFNGFLQPFMGVPDGRYIFAEVQSQPGFPETVSLTEGGQYVFVQAVETYLRDLDFDPDTGRANKWWPQGASTS